LPVEIDLVLLDIRLFLLNIHLILLQAKAALVDFGKPLRKADVPFKIL
jgi:hypothetical protein